MRTLPLTFALAFSILWSSQTLGQADRVALVVGNGNYDAVGAELANPANDAKLIAERLEQTGFLVISAVDQDYLGMRSILRQFDRALGNARVGLVYYAGHGMEYQGKNYLFPTDAELQSTGDIGLALISVDQVMRIVESRVKTRLLFLDACRNNPLSRSFRGSLGAGRAASVGTGLGRMDAAVGTFIAYATAPGDVAADGQGTNSPFSRAVADWLVKPNIGISEFMRGVRNDVMTATGGQQVPWESSSLTAPFIFNPKALPPPPDVERLTENLYWESIQDSRSVQDFQAYLERYGVAGTFAKLAENRIAFLNQPVIVKAPTVARAEPNRMPATDHIGDPLKAERSLKLSARDWRKIQGALKQAGFDPRGIDGKPGGLTRAAIFYWQQANNAKVTGYLSSSQASRLLDTVSQ